VSELRYSTGMPKQKKGSGWEGKLTEFFETPLADKAGSLLSKRATIAIHVEEETFLFRRIENENSLEKAPDDKANADVHFWVAPDAMRHLLSQALVPGTGLGIMGVVVLEHLFATEADKKIKFRVDTGFLGLWAKGYFSVLKAGGPEVASYVARKGFNSVSRIKDVLKNIRG
jgi:hypothetical protein